MSLTSLHPKRRRSFTVRGDVSVPKVIPAKTIAVDRPLSEKEYEIAEWLLLNAKPPATAFLPQLKAARVTGHCSCGCPTADLTITENIPRAEPRENPVGDALGDVDGKMVGVMLLQRDGYLQCLEIYDLDEIERPYCLPDLSSLRPA
jgi:hypothetical protein